MDAVFVLVLLVGSFLFLGLVALPMWLSIRRGWPDSHHSGVECFPSHLHHLASVHPGGLSRGHSE